MVTPPDERLVNWSVTCHCIIHQNHNNLRGNGHLLMITSQMPIKGSTAERSLSSLLPFISTRAPSTFALRIELVRLTFGTSAHCWEHLTLSTTGSKAALLRDYCSGEVREIWRRVLPTNVITSLEISYRSKLNIKNEAGLFWIKVESKSWTRANMLMLKRIA